jgi:hypothetical protein
MNRSQAKSPGRSVVGLAIVAIVMAWISTPASIPPGFLLGCVILATLYVARSPMGKWRARTLRSSGVRVRALYKCFNASPLFNEPIPFDCLVAGHGRIVGSTSGRTLVSRHVQARP